MKNNLLTSVSFIVLINMFIAVSIVGSDSVDKAMLHSLRVGQLQTTSQTIFQFADLVTVPIIGEC